MTLRHVILGLASVAWTVLMPAAHAQLAPQAVGQVARGIVGVVQQGAPIELIREGFQGTEGPLALPDGSLIFTETLASRITRIWPDGTVTPFLDNTNGANGLGLTAAGELWAVQVLRPRVGVIHPGSRVKTLTEGHDGKPFGRPNDLVVDASGIVYFTDSGVNGPLPPGAPEPNRPAVYRIGLQGDVTRLLTDIERPNGIQLSPDNRTLYVANTLGEHVLAYAIGPDGRLGPRRLFAPLEGVDKTATGVNSGADGLAVDAAGRLYVSSNAGVQVFSPEGTHLGTIAVPKRPQNLAFAGPDKRALYVVGRGSVYRLPVLTPGIASRAK